MEHYIDLASRYWSDFSNWSPSNVILYTVLGFGVLSAWVMTRFVSAPPLFAGPISFIALTFAAMVSNFSVRGQVMMGTTDFQKAILFTTIGHAVAGLILLAMFKAGEKDSSQ